MTTENLKQEIRFLFQENKPLEVFQILNQCFEEVCEELGNEENVRPSFHLAPLNITISQVLKYYKIPFKSDGKKGMAKCPFHNDTNPSLSFNDEKNLWKCWGCGEMGTIFTFLKKMEILKKNGL